MPTAQTHLISPTGEQSERRRIRKGTQSCWACKRRKVKCRFSAPQDGTCEGCRRRGISCVGQEFPDVGTSQTRSRNELVEERLGRVEALVEKLVEGTICDELTISSRNPTVSDSGKNTLQIGLSNLQAPQSIGHEEIVSALLSAWPDERTMSQIRSLPADFTSCFHGLICTPSPSLQNQETPSVEEILRLPPTGSHPALIARKLLMLGSYLQGIPSSGFCDSTVGLRDIMSRAIDTAHRLVNCNDELVFSTEGIECIAIESMYYNNAGQLRRSWLIMRRVISIAQMMGLHRGIKAITLEHRTDIIPEDIWFRLVRSDRYLSMMLGLPQSVPDSSFSNADARTHEHDAPVDRLQRIHCDVGGRILNRNKADTDDLKATKDLDEILRNAALAMPPQWWLSPNMITLGASNGIKHYHETIRLMDQLTHYHLLTRLHLPYLLRPSCQFDSSRATAVHASREIVARYVAFRSTHRTGSYCRGVDFLAFISCTILCIVHIEANRQTQSSAVDNGETFFSNTDLHQRPSDRGIMEQVLESVDRMATANREDVIASRIATILRHLLSIEADAAGRGSIYNASSSLGDGESLGCDGKVGTGGNVLHIYIPSFGTMKIQRRGLSRSVMREPSLEEVQSHIPPLSGGGASGICNSHPVSQDTQTEPATEISDWATRYSVNGLNLSPQHPLWITEAHNSFHFESPPLVTSGVDADADQWALQGVDTALFDSMFRGSELCEEMAYGIE